MNTPQPNTRVAEFQTWRRKRRWIIGASIGCVVLIAGGLFVAKRVVWPRYKNYQIKKLNGAAGELIAAKDPVNAMLLVRKSLQKSQANPEAWRLGAMAAKARGQTDAIYYQNQLCKLVPTAANRIDLMRIAADFDQWGLVINTGKEAAKDSANISEYHDLMAKAYQKTSRPIAAKYHLELLCNLRPTDAEARLNLAAFELDNDKDHRDKNLRARIRSLADQPALKRQALAMLLREAVRENHRVDALELLTRFEVTEALDLSDRLLIVQATKLCRPMQLDDTIARLQKDYSSKPDEVTIIFDFLVKQDETSRVKPWFDKLDGKIQSAEGVRRATAEALQKLKSWQALTELLQGGHWETREYLRHALLSHAFHEQGFVTEYFENWKAATMEAGVSARFCMDLLQRLETWRWDSERYDIIWKLFYMFPNNEQLRNQLYGWEVKNKNTPNLNRMFLRIIEIDGTDTVALSNFAYSSFLLNANLTRAGLIAQRLYKLNPNDPYFVTTYAFYLLKQGKLEESKTLMESLRQAALSQPERMCLLAHILAKVGDYERSTELIAGINRNTLLPEEKTLIERAEDEIARGSRTRELISRVSSMREKASNQAATEGGWLAVLQPETRANANPSMQLANSLYVSGDLKSVSEVLRDDNWNELDYLRLALIAQALKAQGSLVQASDSWRMALSGTRRNQQALENLSALCARWGWDEERLQVLNALFELTPNNRVLLAELLEHFRAKRKTHDLIRLLGLFLEDKNMRGDEAVAHAYYSLLSSMNTSQATVRAKECFESEPDNTDARYLQAFALSRQGREAEAARLLAETKGSTSDVVSTPLIQALVSLGVGDLAGASKALATMDTSTALPEEILLAEKLSAQLKAKRSDPK